MDLAKEGPKVLVAAPTYDGCGYALRSWADAYRAFDYENKGALFVDNSDNLHYAHLCRDEGIPTIVQTRRYSFLWDTLEVAWRTIVEYAHDEGYELIASIEADIICPKETLKVMVSQWLDKGPKVIVAHRYHPRGIDNPAPPPEGMTIDREKLKLYAENCWFDTLGCTLFPTELMYATRNEWRTIVEVELYRQAEEQGYERVRMRDILDIVHLEDHEKKVLHAYGEETMASPGRLHPAVLHVKSDEEPEQTGWHGRRDKDTGFAINPTVVQSEAPVKDPVAAQKARDDLKWAMLSKVTDVGPEWTCQRCGRCCTEFEMFTVNEDAEQFWRLRGFPVEKCADGRIRVIIKKTCEWLVNEDGHAKCVNYADRPATCANYTCEKSC